MTITGPSSIDDAVQVMVAESRFVMEERPGVLWDGISKEDFPLHVGRSVKVPKYGTVQTYVLTEGVDLTMAQEITDSSISITPSEYGAKVVVTDVERDTIRDDFWQVAGRLLGASFDRQREQTLCDDAANFSVTAGSAGTAFNLGHAMAMYAALNYNGPAAGTAGRGTEAAPDPIYAFLTPATAHSLKKTMVGGIGAAAATQVVPDLSRAKFAQEFEAGGCMVRTTINLNKDTSDDVVCPIMSAMAWIGVEHGGGPGAKRQTDISLRAEEIVFSGRWGRAEYNDRWGRAFTADSTDPTS